MPIQLLSMNYKNAPLQVRERFAMPQETIGLFLQEASAASTCQEVLGLSTCNRVEFYLPREASLQGLIGWVERRFLLDDYSNWRDTTLALQEEDALRHLFRVACSLESMVVGEVQILGQLKQAHQLAKRSGLIGPALEPLLQSAYRIAKRVHNHTDISRNPVSISHVAVQLAVQVFDDLSTHEALVVGAGEMAELALRCLQREGVRQAWVCNRTFSRAATLAQALNAGVHPFDRLQEALCKVDIVISSTYASHPVILKSMVAQAMKQRRGKPLLLVDIASPHDIEPEAAQLSDVYCYNLDDLRTTAKNNLQQRQQAAQLANQIVEEETRAYLQHLRSRQVYPLVCDLRKAFSQIAEDQRQTAAKALQGLPLARQKRVEKVLYNATHGLIHKLLHAPIMQLKKDAAYNAPDLPAKQQALRDLFNL